MPSPTASSLITSVAPTGVLDIDALARGVRWGANANQPVEITFSFPWTNGTPVFSGLNGTGSYSALNEPSTSFAFNAGQRDAVRLALRTWEEVANVRFVEVADTAQNVGDIRFTWTRADNGDATAWAQTLTAPGRPDDGDIWFNAAMTDASATAWIAARSSNFTRLIHEVGHALGLKHPGNYDNGGSLPPPPFLPAGLDDRLHTVMSYIDPPKDLFRFLVTQADGTVRREFVNIRPDTPMVLDIAAVQHLYGANTHTRAGDDTYAFDPRAPFFRTLWDAGGTDTISVSTFTQACIIDLRPGAASTLRIESEPLPPGSSPAVTIPDYDGSNNLWIALGTTIENAIGGAGADRLVGNEAANLLSGGGGNDTLSGGGGIDSAGFAGPRSAFMLAHTPSGWQVTDSRGPSGLGTDTLEGVERLVFADRRVALDLDGVAGQAARLIGAALGAQRLSDAPLVGAVLGVMDAGVSMRALSAWVVEQPAFVQLVGGTSTDAYVRWIYRNVAGVVPTDGIASGLADFLRAGMPRGEFLALAAESALMAQILQLTGLAATGLEYS